MRTRALQNAYASSTQNAYLTSIHLTNTKNYQNSLKVRPEGRVLFYALACWRGHTQPSQAS